MSDSFTEVTHESWFSRLGNAIKGVLIGVVLFLVSFPLLWWNEGRAVKTAKALKELGGSIVSTAADTVQSQYDGKPVHMTAEATSDETLSDPDFPVTATGIKLRRTVEMYQWEEKKQTKEKKKVGGGSTKETTYTYNQVWKDEPIDSSGFNSKHREGHENPGAMRLRTWTGTAGKVHFGAFTLSAGSVGQMSNYQPLPIDEQRTGLLQEQFGSQMVVHSDSVYLSNQADGPAPDPGSPQIGDLRVSFALVQPATVSIIAQQTGNTFQKWQSSEAQGTGTSVERLEMGSKTAEEMVGKLESENVTLTWLLRLAGLVLMAVGIGMVFSPLAVMADVLPILGDLLRMGIGLFAAAVALSLSLVTIALAWLAYRPVLGAVLLAVAAASVVLLKVLGKKKRAAAAPPVPET